MNDVTQLVQTLFQSRNVTVPGNRTVIFEKFVNDPENSKTVRLIIENLDLLMENWKLENRIADIIRQPIRILNAAVGKPYETKMDFDQYNWNDIETFEFEGLEAVGLSYDQATRQIMGVPTWSGETEVKLRFKLASQPADSPYNEKRIPLIINPDPKLLWKNLESNKDDPYWKPDDVTVFEPLGDRYILVSCKRGRAHANVGSFREDDFAFKHLEDSNWSIVVVADGAGSAKISRKGSALACHAVIEYFTENLKNEVLDEFDVLLQQHKVNAGEDTQKKLNNFVYNNLGKAAFYVHKKLEEFATHAGVSLKDLNTTLIFALFKKYDIGYALLTFGVGDCPIGLLDKDEKSITMMNWIDVGEFGGGTRFITMPEIFQSEKFATRFGFKLIEDFSYLMLMTDGIYDPKFVVEANLEDIKKWKAFLADLNGKNEDGAKVELNPDNPEITSQFSTWMDFWSAGNHDDRTLAIVF
ncbi:MAG: PP2C family serine/threonine-protein phosphatase [Chitinophagaceae bacterium]